MSPTPLAGDGSTLDSDEFQFTHPELMMNKPRSLWRGNTRKNVIAILLVIAGLAVGATAQTSIFAVQKTPSPNIQGNSLNAVAAISTTDAWAVGYQNDNNLNESRTLTQHWDGTSWTTVRSPNPGSTPPCKNSNTGNFLNAVAAVATDDVWAVGFSFTCNALLKPMALHWDGTRWSVVSTPKLNTNDNSALNGIVALASDNVYAVGYQPAKNGAVQTLIEHWDGSAWTAVPSPNGNSTGNVLMSVSATSPSDIWAVGDEVAPNIEVRTLALHFDGSSWSLVPTPNPVGGSDLDQNVLTSVAAVAPDDVTAVGFTIANFTELTMAQHWDGTKWSVVSTPNKSTAAGSFNTLRGVTGVSATDLYAVGFFADSASVGQQLTLILHFDGSAWTIINSPIKGVAQQLNGVFGLPGTTDVWTAGAASRNGTDPETGLLGVPLTLMLFASGG
jgi:hypothetical protein